MVKVVPVVELPSVQMTALCEALEFWPLHQQWTTFNLEVEVAIPATKVVLAPVVTLETLPVIPPEALVVPVLQAVLGGAALWAAWEETVLPLRGLVLAMWLHLVSQRRLPLS